MSARPGFVLSLVVVTLFAGVSHFLTPDKSSDRTAVQPVTDRGGRSNLVTSREVDTARMDFRFRPMPAKFVFRFFATVGMAFAGLVLGGLALELRIRRRTSRSQRPTHL